MSDSANEQNVTNGKLPGYDVPAVEAWISDNVESLQPPFVWTQLEGGHSNLTYALVDQNGAKAVVRRPPEGELLPKAHDMGREFRVISGLGQTPVPVPVAYGYCEDPAVTGAHFYVMSEVSGRAMYTPEMVEEWLDIPARVQLGKSFVETLAALHSVDPDDVGLGELGRRDGYVARQLRTWYGSWEFSKEAAAYDDDRIHEMHTMFNESLPEQGPARVVHGDYGLHNTMVDQHGNLTAVLDWEIATLGDPLADFAYALNAWGDPGAEPSPAMHSGATTAPGFEGPDLMIERYAAGTGADLSQLNYYRAFNYFKTACILHGVYSRYLEGKKSTEGIDVPLLKERMIDNVGLAAEWAEKS